MPDKPELADPSGEVATEPATAGSPPAWRYKLAVVRHYRRVFGLASAVLGDVAEAEDVTQETFCRFWQQGRSVRRERQWLLRVARNLCMDRIRAGARLAPDSAGAIEDAVAPERGPERQLDQSELAEHLRRLIATLPEPQRSLIVLFDLQGMSGEQCASIVGLSIGQVKVYLHRARKRLRQKLEGSYGYTRY